MAQQGVSEAAEPPVGSNESSSEPVSPEAPASSPPAREPQRANRSRERPAVLQGAPPADATQSHADPRFPYLISGVFADSQGLTLVFGKQNEHFLLRLGEVLEETYRLDEIDSQQVTLTYLPQSSVLRIPFSSTITAGMPAMSSPLPRPTQVTKPAAASAKIPLPVPMAAAASSQPARVRLEGPAEVSLGSEFTVSLKISSRTPVGAWPMQVGFDPTAMELVAVQPGTALTQVEPRHFSYTVVPEGSISIAATNPVAAPLADAGVVELTFRPLQQGGTGEIWISALRLQDGAGRVLRHDGVDRVRMTVTD